MKLKEPKYFYKKYGISLLLLPLSLIYMICDKINEIISIPYRSKAKIICIGNIVLGGTGKTPNCIKIIEMLLKKNKKVGVISKGYGSRLKLKNPIIIDTKTNEANEVGDEPYLIASKFKDVPVCVCKNRKKAIKLLEEKVDIIVMDDGFQNYTIKKDIKICIFDGLYGIGNGYIFPAGPMRSTLKKGLKKVNLCIFMRGGNKYIENRIEKYGIKSINGNTYMKDADKLRNKKVIAFAGIGKPNKFYNTLKKNGVRIEDKIDFPDHYDYKQKDIDMLKELSKIKDLPLITTMKDYVKIANKDKKYFTGIDIDIKYDDEKVLEKILNF